MKALAAKKLMDERMAKVKQRVINTPVLNKYINEDNFEVLYGGQERKKLSHGGMLETWFPDDEGVGEFTNPNLGKYTIEVYDDIPDDEQLAGYVYRDALHILGEKDSRYKAYKKIFQNSFSDSEKKFLRKKFINEGIYKQMDWNKWMDMQVVDGYIRGGLGEPSEYGELYKSGNTEVFSPRQRAIIKRIRKYLGFEE